MFKQRILAKVSVGGDVRFVSHHDLMKILGRAVRRAGLPVAMSEGFNPRLKISLLLARGVGVASQGEFAEFDLSDWVGAEEFARRLNARLPDGLRIDGAEVAKPTGHRQVAGIDYRVDCRRACPVTPADALRLLESREIPVDRERKKGGQAGGTRRVDIRPYIRDIRVGERSVEISLVVAEAGTTRVEEVWTALGLTPEMLHSDCTVTRTGMRLAP